VELENDDQTKKSIVLILVGSVLGKKIDHDGTTTTTTKSSTNTLFDEALCGAGAPIGLLADVDSGSAAVVVVSRR
jgi:hypothetical protein